MIFHAHFTELGELILLNLKLVEEGYEYLIISIKYLVERTEYIYQRTIAIVTVVADLPINQSPLPLA